MHGLAAAFIIVAAWALPLQSARVAAADFEVLWLPGHTNVIVMMTGEIVQGDGSRFAEVIESLGDSHATLNVQGPGGLVGEALDIGAQVQIARFATMVSAQAECLSACALIWLGGVRRYLAPDSAIGVHAAYRTDEQGGASVSGVANADIGAYLAHLGLPRAAVRYVASAPPDGFLPITPGIARSLGIEVYEQHGFETITPDEAPTAQALVRKVTELMMISAQCAGFLSLDAEKAKLASEDLLRQAHASFGAEESGEILSWMVDETKAAAESVGIFSWCVSMTSQMTGEGTEVGLDGPSFDCGKAASTTERTICTEPMLWAQDRAVSSMYGVFTRVTKNQERDTLKESQRSWIAWRERCGGDQACIVQVYNQRLSDFGKSDGWTYRY